MTPGFATRRPHDAHDPGIDSYDALACSARVCAVARRSRRGPDAQPSVSFSADPLGFATDLATLPLFISDEARGSRCAHPQG